MYGTAIKSLLGSTKAGSIYDVSELTIPTDNVDEELLARPAQWDIGFIRRFMAFFGPISSL